MKLMIGALVIVGVAASAGCTQGSSSSTSATSPTSSVSPSASPLASPSASPTSDISPIPSSSGIAGVDFPPRPGDTLLLTTGKTGSLAIPALQAAVTDLIFVVSCKKAGDFVVTSKNKKVFYGHCTPDGVESGTVPIHLVDRANVSWTHPASGWTLRLWQRTAPSA